MSFGPYPQSQLRVAEAPAYAKFGGLAMPGASTIIVGKQPAFAAIDPYLTRIDRNRFDKVKSVTSR